MDSKRSSIAAAPELSVVLPVCNEAGNLELLHKNLLSTITPLNISFEIIFVDDGSSDGSTEIIRQLTSNKEYTKGIILTRNFGHQSALLAGLEHAQGNIVITMDSDLQHPPSLIPALIAKHRDGFPIVNARRVHSKGENFSKSATSRLFYKIVNLLSDVAIPEGVADFRLYDRQALDQLLSLRERDRFSRGLASWLGYDQACIDFEAGERQSGRSKYSKAKMIGLALSGVTAFSSRPLRMAFYLGLILSVLGLVYAVYAVILHFRGATVTGWTSTLVVILIVGGVQLVSTGILGEYLARLFHEVKARPHYLVKEKLTQQD